MLKYLRDIRHLYTSRSQYRGRSQSTIGKSIAPKEEQDLHNYKWGKKPVTHKEEGVITFR